MQLYKVNIVYNRRFEKIILSTVIRICLSLIFCSWITCLVIFADQNLGGREKFCHFSHQTSFNPSSFFWHKAFILPKLFCKSTVRSKQGWQLAHWFSEQIAHFLSINELMSDSLKKMSNLLKKMSDWLIRSFLVSDLSDSLLWSLISSERPERIAHGRSFDLSKMSKWAMSEWANSQPWLKVGDLFLIGPLVLVKGSKYSICMS